ncbi:MAG: hypothetical protein AAFR22_23955, partial [Chloroflexota bacterium]
WYAVRQNIPNANIIMGATGAGVLIFLIQGFMLPPLLTQRRTQWSIASPGAAIGASLILVVIHAAAPFRIATGGLPPRGMAVVSMLLAVGVFTLTIGTTQFFMLRRYVHRAWMWPIAVLLSGFIGFPVNVMVDSVLATGVERTAPQASIVLLYAVGAPASALITGVPLWVLVTRFARAAPLSGDTGFRYSE